MLNPTKGLRHGILYDPGNRDKRHNGNTKVILRLQSAVILYFVRDLTGNRLGNSRPAKEFVIIDVNNPGWASSQRYGSEPFVGQVAETDFSPAARYAIELVATSKMHPYNLCDARQTDCNLDRFLTGRTTLRADVLARIPKSAFPSRDAIHLCSHCSARVCRIAAGEYRPSAEILACNTSVASRRTTVS